MRVESLSATRHHNDMPKRLSTDRDFAVNAFRVVEQAIGEHMDGTPLEDPDAGKNPAASDGSRTHRPYWSVDELTALLPEPQVKKRGPYKKRVA